MNMEDTMPHKNNDQYIPSPYLEKLMKGDMTIYVYLEITAWGTQEYVAIGYNGPNWRPCLQACSAKLENLLRYIEIFC